MNPNTTEKLRSRVNIGGLQANVSRLAREGEPPISTHAASARKAATPKPSRPYTLNTRITREAGELLDEIQLLLRRRESNQTLGHNAVCERAIQLLAKELGIGRT